jgi:hypothetical protein
MMKHGVKMCEVQRSMKRRFFEAVALQLTTNDAWLVKSEKRKNEKIMLE